ncbi:hypothetical protein NST41_33245 [Paenibacillus sp. FSL L8-0696]|uniref:hypothetical protein n=1 Tax=Paenibacillus TaxID=44249 RepID=UPI0004B5F6DE|nr:MULTISPECIES: hypothetical protein [Paenibacillus]
MEPRQTITHLSDKNREQLEYELQVCRANAKLALSRYEFLYVEEMSERIKKIKQQLSYL